MKSRIKTTADFAKYADEIPSYVTLETARKGISYDEYHLFIAGQLVKNDFEYLEYNHVLVKNSCFSYCVFSFGDYREEADRFYNLLLETVKAGVKRGE